MMLTEREKSIIEKHWNEISKEILLLAREDAKRYVGQEDLITYRERGEGNIRDLAKMVENPDYIEEYEMEIFDNSLDFVDEIELAYAMNFFDENVDEILEAIEKITGLELDMDSEQLKRLIEEIDFDLMIEIRSEYSDVIKWNIEDLFDYPVLVILKNEEYNNYDCDVEGHAPPLDERKVEKEVRKVVKSLERRYGVEIPENVWRFVWQNMVYTCSKVYLGAIVNGADLYNLITGKIKSLESERLLFIFYNAWLGSADYDYLAETIEIKKEDIKYLDYGDYSIGAIFGTTEWRY